MTFHPSLKGSATPRPGGGSGVAAPATPLRTPIRDTMGINEEVLPSEDIARRER